MHRIVVLFFVLHAILLSPTFADEAFIVGTVTPNAVSWISDLGSTTPTPVENVVGAGSAYNVAFSSSRAYIVGQDENGYATLRMTDLKGASIGSAITLATTESSASGVALSSDRVYIAGGIIDLHNTNPILWITNLVGQVMSETYLLGANYGAAFNVAVSSKYAYVVGEDADGFGFLVITDLNGNYISKTSLSTSSSSYTSEPHGIALSSTNVYITGQLIDPTDMHSYPTLWIADLNGNLTGNPVHLPITDTASQLIALAEGVAVSSNQIFVVGVDIDSSGYTYPTLWITDLNGALISGPIHLPAGTPQVNDIAIANSIALTSSNAYIVGQDDDLHAALWVTDLNGTVVNPPGEIVLSTQFESNPAGIAIYYPSSSGTSAGPFLKQITPNRPGMQPFSQIK